MDKTLFDLIFYFEKENNVTVWWSHYMAQRFTHFALKRWDGFTGKVYWSKGITVTDDELTLDHLIPILNELYKDLLENLKGKGIVVVND